MSNSRFLMDLGRMFAFLALILLCGCFQVKDELTIAADGSGKVRMEVKSSFPPYLSAGMGRGVIYPPSNEMEARQFFPQNAFTLKTSNPKMDANGSSIVIEADFKDINGLLSSAYAKAHGLTIKIDKDSLQLKALSGMELPAVVAESKSDKRSMPMGDPKLRSKTNEMRFEFHVTLPNAVSASNGQKQDKTVTWVSERAKTKDSAEFVAQLSTAMEASCPTNGIKFAPDCPLRMNMYAFKDLPAGTVKNTKAAPDPKRVIEAAKFVPYALQVTRNFDMAGNGGGFQANANLIGEIIVPKEFAPEAWGKVEIEEIVDPEGNSLKIEREVQNYYPGLDGYVEGPADSRISKPTPPKEQKHKVQLHFQAPDWKVKEIASIKASIGLEYFSNLKLIAISNAIPGEWFASPKERYAIPNSDRFIRSPELSRLGVKLNVNSYDKSGFTMLMIRANGKKGCISDLQLFDSAGKTVPMAIQNRDRTAENGTWQIMIAGNPSPPLSLALLVNGGGDSVKVPIVMEHVPVDSN